MEAVARETEDLRDQHISIFCQGGPRIGRYGGKKKNIKENEDWIL